MRPWLARLSFSFFIIAIVLVWEAYQSISGQGAYLPEWKIILYFAVAIVLFILGALGVRERHRSNRD